MRKLIESVERVQQVDEEYTKSWGFNETDKAIERLSKVLHSESNLCRSISAKADDVSGEFEAMREHMSQIEELWDEINYVIGMSQEQEP